MGVLLKTKKQEYNSKYVYFNIRYEQNNINIQSKRNQNI